MTPTNFPFSLTTEELDTLKPSQYILGQVLDSLFIIFSSNLFKDGIKAYILPECFFLQVHYDATFEALVPESLSDVDYIVCASYYSHHWSFIMVDVQKKRFFIWTP